MTCFRRGMAAVVWLGLALVPATSSRPFAHPHPHAQEQAHEEVRGLWVVRSSLTTPQRIDELVRTAVTGGYNTLLVQVRGRGDAYYQSAIDPRATDLERQPATFDPLSRVIDAAHRAGLKVHAWFNVNLVSSAVAGPRSSAHIVSRQPDWLMVPRPLASALARVDPRSPAYTTRLMRWTRGQNDTVEGLFLSPIPEGAQQYTLAVVRDLLQRYPVDGLHLDYIRYPTADFDFSAASLAAFRAARLPDSTPAERQRLDGQLTTDPLAWPRAFPLGWDAFRRDRLTTLVERIRLVMHETRPGAMLSAAVLPGAAEARDLKLQDWSEWAGRGLLDAVCPMAYATTAATFARQVDDTIAGAQGRPVWAGIGAWRLPVARTADHLRVARDRGVAGVLLFSYDSLLTAAAPRGAYFARLRPALLSIDDIENNEP